jgi:nitroreductase
MAVSVMNLGAHPIAGFDPAKIRLSLGIPDVNMVLVLIIVGKKSDDISLLTPKQAEQEPERPTRLLLEKIYSVDAYMEN